jgi:hypothetical protein
MIRAYSTHGRDAYKLLIGKPEGKKSLGGPKRSWEDEIKMVLREEREEVVDWIHLAQNRDQWRALVYMATNLWVP